MKRMEGAVKTPMVKTAMLLAVVTAALTGCATVGGAHTVATPWGVGGLYSFKDKPALAGEPSQRKADVQVAQALDAYEQQQPADSGVRVASNAKSAGDDGSR